MEQWWNDTDREETAAFEQNLSKFYFVHHTPHKDPSSLNPGLCGESQ
jgi:hypothetical protein